jgi:cardiolipin synthase
MADTLQEILCERAGADVRVLLLYDAFGAQHLPPEYFDALRQAGVETEAHRPIRWYSLHKAHHRGHTRAVVIDGEIGYTGGFGIDDKWYGDGQHPGEWRETNVRFTGPAVAQLQAAFAAAWAEATGTLTTGDSFFPL